MVERNETILKYKNGLDYLRVEFGQVEVSNADTVELEGFDDASNLMKAFLLKKSDGSEMTQTTSNNIITVTGSGTDIPCYYIAYGYLQR